MCTVKRLFLHACVLTGKQSVMDKYICGFGLVVVLADAHMRRYHDAVGTFDDKSGRSSKPGVLTMRDFTLTPRPLHIKLQVASKPTPTFSPTVTKSTIATEAFRKQMQKEEVREGGFTTATAGAMTHQQQPPAEVACIVQYKWLICRCKSTK